MVFLSMSMFGMCSPPTVAPLLPSGCIVKWVCGVRAESCDPWCGSGAHA